MARKFLPAIAGVFLATSLLATSNAFADPDVTAQGARSQGGMISSKFGLDIGITNASPDAQVRTTSGGSPASTGGDESDSSTITSIGVDYRFPLFLLFGNIGPFGNAGPDPSGGFYSKGPVGGLWARAFLGGNDQNEVDFDFHSLPSGTDSYVQYSKDFFVMPYVGWVFGTNFGNSNVNADITPFFGVRLEQRTVRLETMEFSTPNTFTNTDTDVGFTFGVDVDFWLDFYNNVGNIGNTRVRPYVGIGAALDYSPDIDVKGRGAVSGLDYHVESEGGFSSRFFIRAGVGF